MALSVCSQRAPQPTVLDMLQDWSASGQSSSPQPSNAKTVIENLMAPLVFFSPVLFVVFFFICYFFQWVSFFRLFWWLILVVFPSEVSTWVLDLRSVMEYILFFNYVFAEDNINANSWHFKRSLCVSSIDSIPSFIVFVSPPHCGTEYKLYKSTITALVRSEC